MNAIARSILSLLGDVDDLSAKRIAEAVDVPLEQAYAELVSLEAGGLARVVVQRERGKMPVRTWEAA